MTRSAQRPTLTVSFQGTTVIGMLLSRGKSGVEAWTVDERSLGIFADAKGAHAAIVDEVTSS
jgi:hypothetical protein